MSTEYRFSAPDYDILADGFDENKHHIIGNARGDCFAWCDFNGFESIQDVKRFMDKNPALVIRDEMDNVISFQEFSVMVYSKEKIFARPLDEVISNASFRAGKTWDHSIEKIKGPEYGL